MNDKIMHAMKSLSLSSVENTISYRADIDGLRAMAIIAVVIFHAFPEKLVGGFIGVDIFFVISGFLISSIIFHGVRQERFSFKDFYAHRVRRIFPALAVVMASSYTAGWFLLLPNEFSGLGKHIAAGAGFVENFVLHREAGYFDIASELKPLLHLWSLAIEEQFYLIYPLLIWGAWRLGLNLFAVIALLFLLSLGCNISWVTEHAEKAFFFPQSRFWELLAGSILVYINIFYRGWIVNKNKEVVLDNIFSFVGLSLILLAVFAIDRERLFPGWWALIPVIGTFMLILAGNKAWINRKFLSQKFVVFMGLISYPLYLWHWPLLSFAFIIEGGKASPVIRTACIFVGVLLSWLTWRLIEKPVRFGRRAWYKTTTLVALMCVLLGIGYFTYREDGIKNRVKNQNIFKLDVPFSFGEVNDNWMHFGDMEKQEFNGVEYFTKKSASPDTTIFIGDSHVGQWYPRIAELIRLDQANTNSAIFKWVPACSPIPHTEITGTADQKRCENFSDDAFKLVKNMQNIKTVVLGGIWDLYIHNKKDNYKYKSDPNELSIYIKSMTQIGKKVFVVLIVPRGDELDPHKLFYRDLKNFPDIFRIKDGGFDRKVLDQRFGQTQKDIARIARESGAVVIDATDFLCNERCEALDANGEPMYIDNNHVRASFVRDHATFIDQTVKRR
jgi:peptidoglycan/LPS O-acetylase OafA/YrhL